MEHKLLSVWHQNFSTKFILEALVGFGNLFFPGQAGQNPVYYGAIKIVRYSRLFEMDSQIKEVLEHYGRTRTVFEIKQKERQLNIL